MPTANAILETAAPSGGPTAARRPVLSAVCLGTVVIASHLPLVLLHFRHLWLHRPHYQFFPLLLAGIAWLLWKRWPRWTVAGPAPRWSSGLLACGAAMLAASTVLWSPWLAAVALVLSAGGLIGRYAVPGQWREWLPVWLVMCLIVPPPFRWDFRLIFWLQSSTSQMASYLLDLLGVLHLMEGHVLVLPGHRMLVDEACSGVNSVLVLLVLTALFAVAARRPLVWSALLLASSVAWAWAGNIIRVTTIAIGQAWYQLDLSSGWQHELLGCVTISLALVWLASTDYCLAFLLRPIVLWTADLPEFASASSPLTEAWNWCVGAERQEPTGPKQREGEGPDHRSASPAEDLPPPARAVGFRAASWLAAFGLLGILQLAGFAAPAGERHLDSVRFERGDMPENLDGWSLVKYELEERELGSQFGQFSSTWCYRRGALECRVSIDYPFEGWHELTQCYRGNGWVLVSRQTATDGEVQGAYVEAELSRPTGEFGWLLFALFDCLGEPLAPSGGPDARWPSIREKLARSPMAGWLPGCRRGSVTETSYQVQVFASGAVRLSPAQRAELRRLFGSVQSRALTVCLGKAIEGERKP